MSAAIPSPLSPFPEYGLHPGAEYGVRAGVFYTLWSERPDFWCIRFSGASLAGEIVCSSPSLARTALHQVLRQTGCGRVCAAPSLN